METAEVYFESEEAYLSFISQIPKKPGDVPGPSVKAVFELMNDKSIDEIRIPRTSSSNCDPRTSRDQETNKTEMQPFSTKGEGNNDDPESKLSKMTSGCSKIRERERELFWVWVLGFRPSKSRFDLCVFT